jgi:hypothetical protein
LEGVRQEVPPAVRKRIEAGLAAHDGTASWIFTAGSKVLPKTQ